MTDYRPIACGLYSQYEEKILHGKPIPLRWREPGQEEQQQTVIPVDLKTRKGEEFLIVKTRAGETLEIRLDWIRTTNSILAAKA